MTMVRPTAITRLFAPAARAGQCLAALALGGTLAATAHADALDAVPQSVLVAEAADGTLDAEAAADDTASFSSVACTHEGGPSAESCTAAACGCDECQAGRHCHDAGCCRLTDCDPPGLFQRLAALHDKSGACWSGRVDALLLWRNAPPGRPIVEGGTDSLSRLNASGMESTPAAGPRVSLFRTDCCGDAWEATWLRAANFRSIRPLPLTDQQYVLTPPGLYGNGGSQAFDSGTANLGSSVQSFELNYHRRQGELVRWIGGFRWVEWQEQFRLQDTVSSVDPPIDDLYQTGCINSMYGGQIGADLYLLSLSWLRVDSVVKAGAYYNNASQSSLFTTTDPANPGAASVTVGQSPASCAFVGEVGLTGAIPITTNLDLRVGYFGLWLSGIAQPTQQLSGQTLSPGTPATGTLATNGGVVLQGVSLGLEGRW